MMEVRGIGIIDVPRMFGINSLTRKSEINVVIKLVPFDSSFTSDRLGRSVETFEILNKKVPLVVLPVSPARSMSEIIEVAVTNAKLKEYGYDSSYEFERRLAEFRKENGGER